MIQSGVTLYKLPRMLAVNFGTNGWLMVLFLSIFCLLNIYLISLVIRFRKGENVFEIMEGFIRRKWMAPLYVLFAGFWSILGILVLKDYILITQVLTFQNTSTFLLLSIVMLLTFYLASKDLYIISKAATIFFVLTIWMTLLMIYHLPYASFIRLTPYWFKGGSDPLQGIIELYTAFLGFELILFMFPYVDETKKKWFRGVYYGHFITTFVYISTCFVSYLYFSLGQLKITSYPVLNLIAYVQIELIERIESLVFNLFLMKILITIVMYFWAASLLFQRAIPSFNRKWSVGLLIAFSMIVTYKIQVFSELEVWLLIFGFGAAGIAIGLPIVLLVVLAIRYRSERRGV